MMLPKRILLFSLVLIGFTAVQAQNNVGIGTASPDSSAALHIEASDQGLLIPRMDSNSRKAINNPAEGLMVYDSTYQSFYYYSNAAWQAMSVRLASNQISDADSDTHIELEESDDEDYIRFYTSGNEILTVDPSGGVGLGKTDFVEDTVILESWDDISYNYVNEGGTGGGGPRHQSFPLSEGYTVQFIDVYFHSLYAQTDQTTLDINIYEGEGTSGTVVYQATGVSFSGFNNGAWIRIDVSDFATIEDTVYSLELSEYEFWSYSTGDGYTGGKSGSSNSSVDSYFRVYGTYTYPITIDATGFRIGAYTLPYTDGNSSTTWINDGTDNVSWQYLSYDFISDTDGGTRITLEESADEDQIRFYADDKEIVALSDSGSIHLGRNLLTSAEVMDSIADPSVNYLSDDGCSCTDEGQQSFTVTDNYELDSIELYFTGVSNGTNQVTLDLALYEGDRTDGTLIYEQEDVSLSGFQNTAWVGIDIPPFNVIAGNSYTLYISNQQHWIYALDFYAGGGNSNNNVDYFLRVYGKDNAKYVNINSDGLGIGDYTLPYADGSSEYGLATDGGGNVNWQGGLTADNQILSLSSNSLSIEEGNTLDLSVLNALQDADGDTKIETAAATGADQLAFTTNDTIRMLIDSAGNVGIGTDAPEHLLHLALDNDKGLNIPLLLTNTNFSNAGGNAIGIGFVNSLKNNPKGAIAHERSASHGRGDLHILLDNVTDNKTVDLDDAVATFTRDGKFGIATTEPDTTFHLIGGFKYEDGNQTNGYVLTTDADGNANWQSTNQANTLSDADGDTKIQVEASADEDIIRFDIAGTQALQINASGNFGFSNSVGIGTNSPAELLHIQVDSNDLNLPLFLQNVEWRVSDSTGMGIGFLSATHNNPKAALFFQRTTDWGLGSLHLLLNNEEDTSATNMDDAMATFTREGYLGIGTTDPINGKLEVIGSATSAVSLSDYGFYSDNNFGTVTSGNLDQFFSIYTDGDIGANEFYAHSDERIKAILGQSDAVADLNLLKQIKVTDYQYKDTVALGNGVQKKVIAQELKAIYPQAVDTTTIKVVPDIYQMASIQNGWVALATDLKVGEQVQLLLEDGKALYEIEEVNAQGFKVASTASGDVFVYGRQVSNFHTVDYQAISMLNVSATQALLKQLETLEKEGQLKAEQIKGLKTQKELLDKRLAKLERMLSKSLESAQNPLTVKK